MATLYFSLIWFCWESTRQRRWGTTEQSL